MYDIKAMNLAEPKILKNEPTIHKTSTIKECSFGRFAKNGAVIGSGAIVTHDIPAYAIAIGNPAHVM